MVTVTINRAAKAKRASAPTRFGLGRTDGSAYHLGPCRYTMLEDAVNYARLLRTQGREVD
jgi:hypothetical protein